MALLDPTKLLSVSAVLTTIKPGPETDAIALAASAVETATERLADELRKFPIDTARLDVRTLRILTSL